MDKIKTMKRIIIFTLLALAFTSCKKEKNLEEETKQSTSCDCGTYVLESKSYSTSNVNDVTYYYRVKNHCTGNYTTTRLPYEQTGSELCLTYFW